MMKIVEYRYFNFILHALVWSIVLLFPYLFSNAGNDFKIGPLPGLYFTLSGIIHIIIFYVNIVFLYPKLLNRSYWWLYIVLVFLLILFSVGVKFFILETWFTGSLEEARSHVLFPSLMVFIVSIIYSITFEKIRAEKMQLGLELKFLRSQVNPHFLFNILTSLVSLARKKSDQLETSLLRLSGLMRYMLHDPGKKISIQQEVEYLESYISLQQLRFRREMKFVINVEGNYNIEPMLLIGFIENAFKHGTDYIDIGLSVKNGILVFTVKNKFEHDTSKDENPGIGLNNVRSRLSLLYPGRHELIIRADKDVFSIYLTLKLL